MIFSSSLWPFSQIKLAADPMTPFATIFVVSTQVPRLTVVLQLRVIEVGRVRITSIPVRNSEGLFQFRLRRAKGDRGLFVTGDVERVYVVEISAIIGEANADLRMRVRGGWRWGRDRLTQG